MIITDGKKVIIISQEGLFPLYIEQCDVTKTAVEGYSWLASQFILQRRNVFLSYEIGRAHV